MMTARGKWKVAAYLTAIFAAGMISGWVVAAREAKTKQPQLPHPPGTSPSQGGPRKPSIYQVDLDPDQKTKIDEIMHRYGKKWDELRLQQGNQMRSDSSNRNYEISELLRPEQREQWEKLRKERDANWRANAGRGGNSNSPRNSVSGEKGEHGKDRTRKRTDGTNAENGRGVTNSPAIQSTNPPAPIR